MEHIRFAVSPGFLKVNRDFYDASVQSLDFAGNPRHALDTIHAWVNENTHAKIPEILNVVTPGQWSCSPTRSIQRPLGRSFR